LLAEILNKKGNCNCFASR